MNKRYNRKLLAAAISALTITPTTGLLAQDESLMLEEVVVTATKRAEGLQDVPIAMSVMSGQKIEKMGIKEMEDIAVYMPNVHVGESGGATQIFIRGVGSGNNFGFEQSVGTFIDGVYYGRARNARAAFLDLERVEVLKGPQSTLFGKNTIAGAINITSAQPTDELEGYIDASYETETDGFGITGAVSGPLTDTLRGRLLAKVYEDEGYMENSAPNGEDGPQEENTVFRGTLVWDATDNLQFNVKAEHGEFDVTGRQQKITTSTPTSTALFGLGSDPNFANTLGFNEKQSIASFPGRDEVDDTESDILQLTAEYQWGEHSLRSITAYTEYEFSNCVDGDYSALAFLDRCRDESHEQFTQEFLLTSPVGNTIEYLAGVYYQDAELQSDASTFVFFSSLPPIEAAILPALPSGASDTELLNFFQQDSETWSAFAELTWNITDSFRTTFGLRYSDDEKKAEKRQIATAPGTGVSDPLRAAIMGPGGLGFAREYEYALPREEDHWTGNLNFQYDLTGDIMAYLNFSTGYKAGGFDADNGLDNSREFEDENVESVELGLKMTLWDGRARVNTALFQSDYDDVQVSSFETVGFVVGNAAETEVFGVEADFEVVLTEQITLNGALAYLDAEFKTYTNAACTVFQQVDGSCAANGGFQDLSGKPLQFAPDLSGYIGVSFDTSLTDTMDLSLNVDALYTDDIVIGPDGDPNVIQDSYWKVNARAAVEGSDGRWMLALVGKNLTDETTFNWGNDATLAGFGLGFEFAYFHIIEAPRTIEIQARYSF